MGRKWVVVCAFFSIALSACSEPTRTEFCGEGGTQLPAGGCLDLSRASLLEPSQLNAFQLEALRTFELVAATMPLRPVLVEVAVDPSRIIPEIGIGGFAPSANRIEISVDATRIDLDMAIAQDLAPLLAHELHHTRRHATVGYGSTLPEAVVSEGLADHFSLELFGGSPPLWSVAIQGEELTEWTTTALARGETPYDHGRWFLGTDATVPRWVGYSIGFELVSQFLVDNPGRKPSELADDPASLFLPG